MPLCAAAPGIFSLVQAYVCVLTGKFYLIFLRASRRHVGVMCRQLSVERLGWRLGLCTVHIQAVLIMAHVLHIHMWLKTDVAKSHGWLHCRHIWFVPASSCDWAVKFFCSVDNPGKV
jgi:hypothetical protein